MTLSQPRHTMLLVTRARPSPLRNEFRDGSTDRERTMACPLRMACCFLALASLSLTIAAARAWLASVHATPSHRRAPLDDPASQAAVGREWRALVDPAWLASLPRFADE